MQKSLACFFALFLGCLAINAQVPTLLKDINNGIANSNPRGMTTAGGTVYFAATDGAHGRELWKTTGTEASTVLVKDINPNGNSNPANFCNVNGTVFFTATTPENGTELWKTDGTAAGTVMVADLITGTLGSEPTKLTACNGRVYFSATRRTVVPAGVIMELKLFVSDGTPAGTRALDPNNTPVVGPDNLTAVGNTLFFSASANIIGNELWRTDGTQAGTQLVRNFASASNVSGNPRNLINVNGNLFLSADNVVNGRQVWRLIPSPFSLTRMTTLQVLGTPGVGVLEMVGVNGAVFFTAPFGVPNLSPELFRLNSVAAGGASKVSNVLSVHNLTAVNANLFFTQSPQVGGPILSRVAFNSLSATNIRTFDLIPNGAYPVPQNLTNVNGTLFFTAATLATGRELWKATTASATFIQDLVAGSPSANIFDLCARGSDVFFASDGIGGNELRSSNGTVNAIVTVRNIGRAGSFPKEFVKMGNFTFFSADDGNTGRELWKTDGTTANTQRVADIIAGPIGSNPEKLIVVTASNGAQTLFFVAKDPAKGRELFKLENTPGALPARISDIVANGGDSPISNLTNLNGVLHFTCSNQIAGVNNIFKTTPDRTQVQTVGGGLALADNLVAMGSTLFFTQTPSIGGPQLWKLGGAAPIKTFATVVGGASPIPQQLTVIGSRLFFTAADGQISRRVWVTNAAATSVSQVSSHNASELTNFNGRLVYTAASGNIAGQNSIFRVNVALNGVETLATGSSIGGLRAAGTNLFFFQAFHQGVVELSKITTLSNVIVSLRTFPEGNTGIAPQMIVAGNNLFFTMTVAAFGNELWKSNGTANGTLLVSDIRPGVGNSNVHALAVCGTDLFFSANNLVNGQEPWKLANATAAQGDEVGDRETESEEIEEMVVAIAVPEIKVYPNPTTNFVNVDLPQNDLTGTLSILSASGQMVRSVQSSEGETSIQMDVQDLPKGVYLVRFVQSDEQVVVKKLIVQ